VGGFVAKILILNLISQKLLVLAGIRTKGLGVNCRSLVPLPPPELLLAHVIPVQVLVMVLSPSYDTWAPASGQGIAALVQSSSKRTLLTVSVVPPGISPAPSVNWT